MPNVHFELTGDEAKAVQAFLRVVDVQSKATEGFRKTKKAGKEFSAGMDELASTLKGVAAGFAGLSAVQAVGGFLDFLDKRFDKLGQFDRELTSLFGHGQNIQRMGELKSQVLAISNTFGLTREEAAGAMLTIQDQLEQLGSTIEGRALGSALRLHAVMGMQLPQATALTTKAFQVFGDQLGDTARAEDRMMQLADALGVQNPSEFLAAVGPQAKRAGASFDELVAVADVWTRQGGKSEQTAEALRATFRGLASGLESGVIPQMKTFEEQLRSLRQLGPTEMKSLFGDTAAGELGLFLQNLDQAIEKMKTLRNAPGGEMRKKEAAAWADQAHMARRISDTTKGLMANADLGGVDKWTEKQALDMKLSAAGWEDTVSPGAKELMNMVGTDRFNLARLSKLIHWKWGELTGSDSFKAAALEKMVSQARQAGDTLGADMLNLAYGDVSGMKIGSVDVPGPLGIGSARQDVFTGPEQAREYAGLLQKRPWLTSAQYMAYLRAGYKKDMSGSLGSYEEFRGRPEQLLTQFDPNPGASYEASGEGRLARTRINTYDAAHAFASSGIPGGMAIAREMNRAAALMGRNALRRFNNQE